MAGDWQMIKDDREKYAAYLCSREWAEKRDVVHKRANGRCERCKIFGIDAVHHLTYVRKYNEKMEDLEGHCKWCHGFTHNKHNFDPTVYCRMARYFCKCLQNERLPLPYEIQDDLRPVKLSYRLIITAIDQLLLLHSLARENTDYNEEFCAADSLEQGVIALSATLPFDYYGARAGGVWNVDVQWYASVMDLFGFTDVWSKDWGPPDEE